MNNCVFCCIANGTIPSKRVYEDDLIVAFYDLEPQAAVHVLVIPRQHIACADEFITDLDLMLGEKGSGLSEGQLQRIAIARAICSGGPILLLDEATSALDSKTEKELLDNLRSLTDKTVIIVTHRPAALSVCDRVIEF